jgi:sugar O-acyltransferase (sialic acid O-acetyltransferase NeuD family)
MKPQIVFWGARGHARVLRELCDTAGYRLVALFDNDRSCSSPFPDVTVHHGRDGFRKWREGCMSETVDCLVAIGGARGRDRVALQRFMAEWGLRPSVAIHASAFVAADATLGAGSQILAQAAICSGAAIGEACIVNTKASVDHDCRLGDGVHLAPGVTLAGCVSVGEATLIGPAAVVLPRLRIGANSIVGAGAVVTRDLPDHVVAYGNPARIVRANPADPGP